MFSLKRLLLSGLVAALLLQDSDALICKDCSYCPNPALGKNTTCPAGFDTCMKLDLKVYVYRGCAKKSNCASDGSGLNDGGPMQASWAQATGVAGAEYSADLLKQGKVVNCCDTDYCNGVLRHALSQFVGLIEMALLGGVLWIWM